MNVLTSIVLYFEAFILDDMQPCFILVNLFVGVFMESDVKDWQMNVISPLEQARSVLDQVV